MVLIIIVYFHIYCLYIAYILPIYCLYIANVSNMKTMTATWRCMWRQACRWHLDLLFLRFQSKAVHTFGGQLWKVKIVFRFCPFGRFYTILYNHLINIWILIGLNGLKCSYNLPERFAQHPGHFWDGYFLATLLYYWNIGPILTKQRFRRKQARHQVVFKSAMGKLNPGTVRSFHVFGEKGGLLL